MNLWEEIARKAKYQSTKMAQLCGISVRTLERIFQKKLKQTPNEWLRELRDQEARKLLQTKLSLKEIAYELGFAAASNFGRAFRARFKRSPGSVAADYWG